MYYFWLLLWEQIYLVLCTYVKQLACTFLARMLMYQWYGF